MIDDDDAGKSFLKHMRAQGAEASLVAYANLIYAELAKVPVPRSKAKEFLRDLLPYVSRCTTCGKPMGAWLDNDNNCGDCGDLYGSFCVATDEALQRHKDDTFCCLELEGLAYRKQSRGEQRGDVA